ncbi:NADPH-dependent F420 reductase [Calidithermus chliarophilus]|uniref:NADPH-dependent F420 reductase n=1 Tax=Calidithermus chliarophilus TaxID=52023 RepID=UPI00041F159B|nr:NAD(P)-binding domain-containing protein [Calidithermus chliarophilus]
MSPTSPAPELGVLGAGRMGLRLAAMFARAGRRVVLGSRDPERAARLTAALGLPGLTPGSYADAARAGAVLPAVFIRDGLFDLLGAFAADLKGKLLIDISNPFNADYSDYITPWDSSGAEEMQKRFPRARVVGAYKHVYWEVFDEPLFEGTPSDVLVVGDDEDAKRAFLALAEGTPFRYLDAGPLINARTVERLTLITGRLGRQMGYYPRMNWRLLGEAWQEGRKGPAAPV